MSHRVKRKKKKNEKSTSEQRDNFGQYNIYVIGIPGGEKMRRLKNLQKKMTRFQYDENYKPTSLRSSMNSIHEKYQKITP